MKKKSKKAKKKIEALAPLPMSVAIEKISGASKAHPVVGPLANNPLVHAACIVFLITIVYSNTLNAPFQWDESSLIVDNPIIKDIHYFISPSDAKGFALYTHLVERYVGYLTFAGNYRMHGLSVTGYHIVNIAIHAANSILVYWVVLLTFGTPFLETSILKQQAKYVAFFSAVLFAIHPMQTMAVTYVFQRMASLTTFFYLLSLTAYIKSRLSEGKQQRVLFYSIAFISAVLAMKTKENAFTLPLMITLFEFCFFTDSMKKRALHLAPMILTMSIIPLTLLYLKGIAGREVTSLQGIAAPIGSHDFAAIPWSEYMLTEFRVIITYLRLLFMPVHQNIDYDYPVFKSILDMPVILSFLFLLALFGLGLYLVKDKGQKANGSSIFHYSADLRLMGFGILWFFIALSVESSIVPLDRLIDEYRVYLPSVGVIICVVTGAFLLKEKARSLRNMSMTLRHPSSTFSVFSPQALALP